jgi:ferredoxin-thioredoxin reductase catalytic chain
MPGRLPIPKPEERPQVEARLRKMVQRWPEVSGYHLNPDPVVVEGIVQALVRSVMRTGYPYCPCRDLTGDPEKDRANICPCQWHHREIREQGYCKCVLFVGDRYNPEKAYRPKEEGVTLSAIEAIRHRWVTVYLTNWCAHSRRVKAFLQQAQIPFEAVDIEADEAAAQQVEAWNRGYRSVPTVVVRLIVTEPFPPDLEALLVASQAQIMECRVYITSWCAHSRRTMAWLKERRIPFEAIDIERDREAAKRVQEWNKGFLSVPTLDITLRATEPTTDQLRAMLGLGTY